MWGTIGLLPLMGSVQPAIQAQKDFDLYIFSYSKSKNTFLQSRNPFMFVSIFGKRPWQGDKSNSFTFHISSISHFIFQDVNLLRLLGRATKSSILEKRGNWWGVYTGKRGVTGYSIPKESGNCYGLQSTCIKESIQRLHIGLIRFGKNQGNIDSFRGFIEQFSLFFEPKWSSNYTSPFTLITPPPGTYICFKRLWS